MTDIKPGCRYRVPCLAKIEVTAVQRETASHWRVESAAGTEMIVSASWLEPVKDDPWPPVRPPALVDREGGVWEPVIVYQFAEEPSLRCLLAELNADPELGPLVEADAAAAS